MSEQLNKYYQDNLSHHGASAQGVGWKNEEAQQIRFSQLIKVIYSSDRFSVNDAGCGVGDLSTMLNKEFSSFTYTGYDMMADMISQAKKKYPESTRCQFYQVTHLREMNRSDYSMASGILNLKFDCTDMQWKEFILETLHLLNDKSQLGFAFNALTKYSDKEFMKPELYYADPLWLFDYCKTHFAKNIALLHDYSQYDFTILVKKNF